MLSILHNSAAMAAQNQLSILNSALQQTLVQLSSRRRVNSGADDAAGLSIADGLNANIAARTHSALNANDGVSKLQVADGALSQVTNLLNRAVTLSTADTMAAISTVSALRGSIGAGMNRLQAAANVMNDQTQNLIAAEDGVVSADLGQTVEHLTKYRF